MPDPKRETAWAAYVEALECKLELAAIARETSAIKLILAERKLAALRWELKYRPDQPRVPAGYREGGQWTLDGAGTPSAHPRRRSPTGFVDQPPPFRPPPGSISERDESTPDLGAILGIGTADAAEPRTPPPRIYRVDIVEEDDRGGHTRERHVGKSDAYLLGRLHQTQTDVRIGAIKVVQVTYRFGSFTSIASANALTSSNLARNSALVDQVATGEKEMIAVTSWYGSPTGKEAYANQAHQAGAMRPTYGVRTVIVHDSQSAKGFRVITSFPLSR